MWNVKPNSIRSNKCAKDITWEASKLYKVDTKSYNH